MTRRQCAQLESKNGYSYDRLTLHLTLYFFVSMDIPQQAAHFTHDTTQQQGLLESLSEVRTICTIRPGRVIFSCATDDEGFSRCRVL